MKHIQAILIRVASSVLLTGLVCSMAYAADAKDELHGFSYQLINKTQYPIRWAYVNSSNQALAGSTTWNCSGDQGTMGSDDDSTENSDLTSEGYQPLGIQHLSSANNAHAGVLQPVTSSANTWTLGVTAEYLDNCDVAQAYNTGVVNNPEFDLGALRFNLGYAERVLAVAGKTNIIFYSGGNSVEFMEAGHADDTWENEVVYGFLNGVNEMPSYDNQVKLVVCASADNTTLTNLAGGSGSLANEIESAPDNYPTTITLTVENAATASCPANSTSYPYH